jgi:ABC-type Zn uptake system ZnuABC Zn-binding protein ZnuA
MKRLWWLALLAPCLLLVPFACSEQPDPWKDEPGHPRVVVTIAPLSSFVRGVAGDRAAIKCLCTTTGPHHYETNYSDARLMDKADAVFYVGLQLDETFTKPMHRLSRRGDSLPLVNLGEKLTDKGLVHKMGDHVHGSDDASTAHHHGEYDPHVWLGIKQAKLIVEVIRDTLCQVDADHAEEYQKNAAAYLARLDKLHKDGEALLAKKQCKRIISFHDAFEYFSRSFGLQIAAVIELAPGESPSPQHLANLRKLCLNKENPIGAITVEPQFPLHQAANNLQNELKAGPDPVSIDLVSIDPLETADRNELKTEGADWYENRMRQNLEALDKVLK